MTLTQLLRGWGGMKVTGWRKIPLLLLGYDIERWEYPGHTTSDYYDNSQISKFASLKTGAAHAPFGPTHLQYRSPFGFLLVWPLCFHLWFQFREQTPGVPGSESVLYFRIGFGRWDAGDSVYMVPTLYLGGRWD